MSAPATTPRSSREPPLALQLTPAEAERAFRQARRTVFGHLIFIAACCVLALILRKLLHLPAVMIGAILIAGLAVFANDIVRMFICRHQLQRALSQAMNN